MKTSAIIAELLRHAAHRLDPVAKLPPPPPPPPKPTKKKLPPPPPPMPPPRSKCDEPDEAYTERLRAAHEAE